MSAKQRRSEKATMMGSPPTSIQQDPPMSTPHFDTTLYTIVASYIYISVPIILCPHADVTIDADGNTDPSIDARVNVDVSKLCNIIQLFTIVS
ncbi:hypothetical protein PVK06_009331 [Gossypium arboreum]|uniref:Uncharacterized protein n=1 Tax=Gossypium arboreum TaxID=29729 RepID=A0ABR0QM58_GOSAR|nr:hypothetical protein PVK06_009331 [Gossypium arboreum]